MKSVFVRYFVATATMVTFFFLMIAFADYIRAYFGKNKKIYDLEG